MQQLIIDRSKWRTGGILPGVNDFKKYGDTHLLNKVGMMCCLGFYCEQIENIPKLNLLEVPLPEELSMLSSDSLLIEKHYNDKKLVVNTEFTVAAIDINDDKEISFEEREEAIAEHFKTIGVEVIFIDKYI